MMQQHIYAGQQLMQVHDLGDKRKVEKVLYNVYFTQRFDSNINRDGGREKESNLSTSVVLKYLHKDVQ